jgi:hypothetical protein
LVRLGYIKLYDILAGQKHSSLFRPSVIDEKIFYLIVIRLRFFKHVVKP